MQNVSKLNHTIGKTIRQEISPDPRNISTFIDAILHVIASQNVRLSAWISWTAEAIKAGSCIRRFARWLYNFYRPSCMVFSAFHLLFA